MRRSITVIAGWMLPLLLLLAGCASDPVSVPPPSLTIGVYGDSRTNHDVHQRVVDALILRQPAAVFHAGDLVEDGLDPGQWEIFNTITANLRQMALFFPALGNHEYNSPLYFANFELPGNERWYRVLIDAITFVVLDTGSDLDPGSEQYRWLEGHLQGIAPADFSVAVFHYPPLSVGSHAADEKGLLQSVVPLFEEYDVDVVFAGHDHAYQRFFYNDIYYIVTGGGGAPLHDQARTSPYLQVFLKEYHFCTLVRQNNQLRLEVFGTDSQLLDSCLVDP